MAMIEIRQVGRALVAAVSVVALWVFVWAPASGCDGTFARDAAGYQLAESGLVPARAPRKVGDTARFVGWDAESGRRYFVTRDAVLYPERDVKLAGACRLDRDARY